MDERERRKGLNEAMIREVNERVKDLNQAFGSITGTFDIICECADKACTEQVTVPVALYERARSEPTQFLLKPGHEDPTVERTIEIHDSCVIVEKEGVDVEQVAEETDPRQDDD